MTELAQHQGRLFETAAWPIQEFFKRGLNRDLPPLLDPDDAPTGMYRIELGPGDGRKVTNVDLKLGMSGAIDHFWRAGDPLPLPDESVWSVQAYQFMEHLSGDTAVNVLREIERVLVPGGIACLVMPYYNSAHMAQALDHRSFWSEETWHWLFGNEYYSDHEGDGWRLRVHACFIMGIVERNIDLFTQLIKE